MKTIRALIFPPAPADHWDLAAMESWHAKIERRIQLCLAGVTILSLTLAFMIANLAP